MNDGTSPDAPLVSICLPSLNTRPFLEERIASIRGQTFVDWELVVTDSYSDDGSWEFFQALARDEPRCRIDQAPRGLYPSWNHCLRQARGRYVYVATSDDVMALDCIGKMAAALEAHPECDLAHCPLRITDGEGRDLASAAHPPWPDCTVFAHGLGDLAHRPHVRRAPYDGLLHLTGEHVILSVNQLLVRRSLFERTGFFESTWGSVGDFNWEMRAGLLADTVHVPDTWTTWRIHGSQATAVVDVFSPERGRKIDLMIDDAFAAALRHLPPALGAAMRADWIEPGRRMRGYYSGLRERRAVGERRRFQLERLLAGGNDVRGEILGRALGRPRWPDVAPERIRAWLSARLGRPAVEAVP
jgi:glycosyltransferase involved in cell wall biosynthesis